MFITTNEPGYLRMLLQLILLAVFIFALGALISVNPQAVKPRPVTVQKAGAPTPAGEQPLLRDYKGVALGMTAQEVRRTLGQPADTSDEQDFYNFSETETAQIFYDASGKVKALSAHFAGAGAAGAPTPKAIFGEDVPPKADGSVFKLVRYSSVGCWVSYSRTAGDQPLVTVSMQKLN